MASLDMDYFLAVTTEAQGKQLFSNSSRAPWKPTTDSSLSELETGQTFSHSVHPQPTLKSQECEYSHISLGSITKQTSPFEKLSHPELTPTLPSQEVGTADTDPSVF